MKTKIFLFVSIAFVFTLCDSCKFFDSILGKYKEEKKRGKDIFTAFDNEKKEIYKRVKQIKNNNKITGDNLENLKKDYKDVKDEYNKNFTTISGSLDAVNDPNLIRRGSCVVGGYSILLNKYEKELEASSKKGATFLKNADKALNTPPDAGAGVGGFWPGLILPVLNLIANEKIQMCKDNIDKMKYEDWDEVK